MEMFIQKMTENSNVIESTPRINVIWLEIIKLMDVWIREVALILVMMVPVW